MQNINNKLLIPSLFNKNNEYLDFALKNDEIYMISQPNDESENFKKSTFLQILFYISYQRFLLIIQKIILIQIIN